MRAVLENLQAELHAAPVIGNAFKGKPLESAPGRGCLLFPHATVHGLA